MSLLSLRRSDIYIKYTWYRLVQVKCPNFSPPRIPFAISSQRVNIWYHSGTHGQVEEGDTAKKKTTGLGLSAGAKLVSTSDRPSIIPMISRHFSQRRREINCATYCTIRLDVLQGMSVGTFAPKNRRSNLPVFIQHYAESNENTGSYTTTKSFEGNNVSY